LKRRWLTDNQLRLHLPHYQPLAKSEATRVTTTTATFREEIHLKVALLLPVSLNVETGLRSDELC